MFEGRKLDHIGLQVPDSEKDAKFYMEKLGFLLRASSSPPEENSIPGLSPTAT